MKVVPSDPGAVTAAAAEAVSRGIRCAMPGFLEDFDSGTFTATIRLAVPDDDGTEFPLLDGVPVFDPGRFFAFSPGDGCLVVFADRCADACLTSGTVAKGSVDRVHDLSDAFAFVGFPAFRKEG